MTVGWVGTLSGGAQSPCTQAGQPSGGQRLWQDTVGAGDGTGSCKVLLVSKNEL